MRICVTGGAGFIGANVVRRLVASGFEVSVLDDLSTGDPSRLTGSGARIFVGSVLNRELLLEAMAGSDSVVHLAAVPSVPRSLVDPVRSHDVNAGGTLAVLEVAREHGVHVAVASSSSVYGHNPELPKSESMTPIPASPYAVSKLAAESYTLAYRGCFDVRAVAFRFFNVFGPLQAPGHAYAAVIPAFVSAALLGEPLRVFGDGEQSRDFTFVDTVVDVLEDAVSRQVDHGRPLNLALGSRTSLNEVILKLEALLGRRLEVDRQPDRRGDVRHSQASSSALRRVFPAVRSVSLEDGLFRTIEWMESEVESTVSA